MKVHMFEFIKIITIAIFVLTPNIYAETIPLSGKDNVSLEAFDKLMTSFMVENNVPGAALAITKNGRLVYAKGFGWADREKKLPMQPHSLFRIASLSKAITGAAVMQLYQEGKLDLFDYAVSLLNIEPYRGYESMDKRWNNITIKHLLQHEAGWTRENDPIKDIWKISRNIGKKQPISNRKLISYMMSRSLDFSPGSKYSYSNFGYTLLGRIIEDVSHTDYENYVQRKILKPLGIKSMQIGRRAPQYRAKNEVKYYDPHNKTAVPSFGLNKGKRVPVAYTGNNIKVLDSVGGWIASAPDIARFISSFDNPKNSPILKESTIKTIFAPKDGPDYYSCGWMIRPTKIGMNTFHFGAMHGTSTIMLRRYDGLNWVLLFNMRHNKNHKQLAHLIDIPLHNVANKINEWPKNDLFYELGYK